MNFINIAKAAKIASLEIADLSTEIKNEALLEIAKAIEENAKIISETLKECGIWFVGGKHVGGRESL